MSNYQYFKIKRGTNFHKDVVECLNSRDKWKVMFDLVSEVLGQKITRMAFDPEALIIDLNEIEDVEVRKLFKKNGALKKNSNEAKRVESSYKNYIDHLGLSNYKDLTLISFIYGAMRRQGQQLERFITSEKDIFYKADFDLEKETKGLVIPITAIEYHETHLAEIKKYEEKEKTNENKRRT